MKLAEQRQVFTKTTLHDAYVLIVCFGRYHPQECLDSAQKHTRDTRVSRHGLITH